MCGWQWSLVCLYVSAGCFFVCCAWAAALMRGGLESCIYLEFGEIVEAVH